MFNLTNAVNKACKAVCHTVTTVGIGAGMGYLSGRAFTFDNPINGAAYGAVFALVSTVTTPLFQAIFHRRDANLRIKFIGWGLCLSANTTASSYITDALGCPLPLLDAAQLALIVVNIKMLMVIEKERLNRVALLDEIALLEKQIALEGK